MDEVLRSDRGRGKSFRDFLAEADNKSNTNNRKPHLADYQASGAQAEDEFCFEQARKAYAHAYSCALNQYGSSSKECIFVLIDRFRVEIASGNYDAAYTILSQTFASVPKTSEAHRLQIRISLQAARICASYGHLSQEITDLVLAAESATQKLSSSEMRLQLEVLNVLSRQQLLLGRHHQAQHSAMIGKTIVRSASLGSSLPGFENALLLGEVNLHDESKTEMLEGLLTGTLAQMESHYSHCASTEERNALDELRLQARSLLSSLQFRDGRENQAEQTLASLLQSWSLCDPPADLKARALIELARIQAKRKDLRMAWHSLDRARKHVHGMKTKKPSYACAVAAQARIRGEIALQLYRLPAYKIEMLLHGDWSALLLSSYRSLPQPIEEYFSEFDGESDLTDFIQMNSSKLRAEAEQRFHRAEELLLALPGEYGSSELMSVATLHAELLSSFGDVEQGRRIAHNLRSQKQISSHLLGKYANLFEAA